MIKNSVWALTLLLISSLFASVQANEIKNIRISTTHKDTRAVIDLTKVADYSFFTLDSPERIVVDIKNATNRAKLPKSVTKSPILSKVRASSPPNKSTVRLVFELKGKASPNVFKLKPGNGSGHRLVVDIPFGQSSSASQSTAKTKPVVAIKSNVPHRKEVLIAIDPGHGGKDPGSIGPSKKYEKHVTLSIAKKLAAQLNAIPGIRTKLTRTGNYYVPLDQRVAIADKYKAHLFISIHADAFTSPRPRGASVFFLNDRRRNTEISRWVENQERQSRKLGGTSTVTRSDKNVNQTLLDLQFTHSKREGEKLATEILGELKKVARLHKDKPSEASLAVLRSPQIPSVLVETGFISNPTEEKLLFQRSYQDKLAGSITRAVVTYLKENPPEGTTFDKSVPHHHGVYVVQRGDFLSKIAANHNVSVSAIKAANKLKSDTVKVGQRLTIPGATASRAAVPVSKLNTVETKSITHVVKAGEYLGKIANQYKVSVAAIQRENNLKSSKVHVGQKLRITVAVKDAPIRKHKVQRGEFLGKIASKYGVSVSSIRSANKLRSDELAIGQVLIIPNR
ncbi:N-acetylmuramoyl-L-alanine amidase [Vibrio ezurae]|uniref:N-acetylmuramoyl-L-alanine amidase n=1 Tax=Vibrio ezurae NBRC 102218 TaxID=1219080 RepID=U3CUA7_9VIBR|nr:N-acetylmuramoyl-L-alanine amidase [Vibrio ezurae]GAD81318.1 putative N-acetylmuramoyl-L-alanine amidase [Vibrio ezurae NBRC 102218]